MPSFNDDHLGFSGPELNGVNAINITAAGGKPFSLHNAVSFESTATMANLPIDNTVTRAVGVDGSGNLVNTSKVVDADITALTTAVNTKADTSVVTALTAVVATKASSTVVGSKASQVEVDSIAATVADKADTSTVTALSTTVASKADTSTVTALSTTVASKADDNAVVKTSGDQSIGGQKTWTGAQINIGGLYTLGTVTHQGTGNRAVTIQSSNPGGGVNSELRLVTADNTNSSNPTLNTGTLKYNGATSTMEIDKPLSVTGAITASAGVTNTVTLDSNQNVGGEKTFVSAATFASDVEILGTTTIGPTEGATCTIKGTCAIQGGLTMTSGTASLKTTTVAAGHDIDLTGDNAGGVFARVVALEADPAPAFGTVGFKMVHQILPASVIGTSHQLFARYRTVKIGTGDYGHMALQSHKGSNNIQNVRVYGNDTSNRTVNDGGAVDKTNSGGDTATVQFNDSDLTSGVADHMFTSFAGYLYWGTGWGSNVRTADNRMVRVSVTATEGLNLFCDGKIVAAQSRESTHSISAGGTGVRHYVFTARGDYTAIEGHITSDDTALVTRLDFTCFSYWSN